MQSHKKYSQGSKSIYMSDMADVLGFEYDIVMKYFVYDL
jgi:hypothetical protein